nr:MAG TPA: hypothetical protein [Caudoviricetes sp.]
MEAFLQVLAGLIWDLNRLGLILLGKWRLILYPVQFWPTASRTQNSLRMSERYCQNYGR